MLRLLPSLIALALLPIATAVPASAASCSPDPAPLENGYYELSTPGHLEWLRADNTLWGNDYLLTSDIDMSGCSAWNSTIGSGLPSGFSGSIDGGGFTVRSLTINISGNDGGFIGLLSGSVANLGMEATVTGTNDVGGLVGQATSGSEVSNSFATGTVTGQNNVGGLIGYAPGSNVSDSYATGSVSGAQSVGGLIGYATSATDITRTAATGSLVTGTDRVGGLVGFLSFADVSNSFATGEVQASVEYAGGLIGQASAPAQVTNAYSTGDASAPNFGDAGGLVGNSQGANFTSTYYSGNPQIGPGTSVTTAQLQTLATFTGWSIAEGYSPTATWGICSRVNGGLPFLTAFYSTDPCSDPLTGTATAPTYAEFVFLLPDGRVCSDISPVRVQIGTEYELPGVDASCRLTPESRIDGWTIPVPPGFTGAGSSSLPFSPGHLVDVSDSQQFTAVLWEPILTLFLDANVSRDDACVVNDVAHATEDGRGSWVWVPRVLTDIARNPDRAPCTPAGYELIGWNTRGDGGGMSLTPGEFLPEAWRMSRPNERTLYAVWRPATS